MSNSSEAFRTEFVAKLFKYLPPEQIKIIMDVLDMTLGSYDISMKTTQLITMDGVPEAVKYFIASKAVENLSYKTLNIYRLRLSNFFDTVKKSVLEVTATDIRTYLYYYKTNKKASDNYLDSIRRILNSFFSWLLKNEYILRNPCDNIEKIKYQSKVRKPLSSYELEILRWNCKTLREKALVDFLFSTGIRLSECNQVNISDIDWNKRSVIIHHGKGNKRRIVFFNAESEVSLKKYLESRTDSNEALFVTIRKPYNRLCIKGIENEIGRAAKRSNLHVFPHKLRHTFATSGIHGGMPLEKLQALMGHTKPETTLIYAKLDESDLQKEHERIYV